MQSESTESRVQRVRESKVESAEIVSAESVCTVREHSGESAESRVPRVRGHRLERRESSVRCEHSVRVQRQSADHENVESRVQRV